MSRTNLHQSKKKGANFWMPTARINSRRFNQTEKQTIMNMNAQKFTSSDIGKALNVTPNRVRMFLHRFKALLYTGSRVILKKSKLDGYVGTCVERLASELPQFGVRRLAKVYKQRYPNASYYPGPSQIDRLLRKRGFHSGFKSRAPGMTVI